MNVDAKHLNSVEDNQAELLKSYKIIIKLKLILKMLEVV